MSSQPYHTDRVDKCPDAALNAAETSEADTPIISLPNPGESSPVDSGNSTDNGGIPVTSLPNPGESGPVDSDDRPFSSIFRLVSPGGTGGFVTVISGIALPCFNCTAISLGHVRFPNASTGYQLFYVYLGNWMVASGLANGDITSYVQPAFGTQTVTVSGANGYVYIQKSTQVSASSSMAITIIGTANGLDTMEIFDISCNAPSGNSCLCTCNLSQSLGPFDVSIGNQNNSYAVFTNVRYREVMPYASLYPGWYQLYIARTGAFSPTYVATAITSMSTNMSYTLYTFNASNAAEGLRTMAVSN